jgi:DNA-binding NarL/FixJ family response regulator
MMPIWMEFRSTRSPPKTELSIGSLYRPDRERMTFLKNQSKFFLLYAQKIAIMGFNPGSHQKRLVSKPTNNPHKKSGARVGNIIHVVIVEDDPFARNWMVLLAARDWRTRVVGETDEPSKLLKLINELTKENLAIDFIVLDTEMPSGVNWISKILTSISSLPKTPKVLFTGIRANPQVLRQLDHPCFGGYLIKDEIHYSFAWAISLAIEGSMVITESVQSLAADMGFRLPDPGLVLDGRKVTRDLSERRAHVARLAFFIKPGIT